MKWLIPYQSRGITALLSLSLSFLRRHCGIACPGPSKPGSAPGSTAKTRTARLPTARVAKPRDTTPLAPPLRRSSPDPHHRSAIGEPHVYRWREKHLTQRPPAAPDRTAAASGTAGSATRSSLLRPWRTGSSTPRPASARRTRRWPGPWSKPAIWRTPLPRLRGSPRSTRHEAIDHPLPTNQQGIDATLPESYLPFNRTACGPMQPSQKGTCYSIGLYAGWAAAARAPRCDRKSRLAACGAYAPAGVTSNFELFYKHWMKWSVACRKVA